VSRPQKPIAAEQQARGVRRGTIVRPATRAGNDPAIGDRLADATPVRSRRRARSATPGPTSIAPAIKHRAATSPVHTAKRRRVSSQLLPKQAQLSRPGRRRAPRRGQQAASPVGPPGSAELPPSKVEKVLSCQETGGDQPASKLLASGRTLQQGDQQAERRRRHVHLRRWPVRRGSIGSKWFDQAQRSRRPAPAPRAPEGCYAGQESGMLILRAVSPRRVWPTVGLEAESAQRLHRVPASAAAAARLAALQLGSGQGRSAGPQRSDSARRPRGDFALAADAAPRAGSPPPGRQRCWRSSQPQCNPWQRPMTSDVELGESIRALGLDALPRGPPCSRIRIVKIDGFASMLNLDPLHRSVSLDPWCFPELAWASFAQALKRWIVVILGCRQPSRCFEILLVVSNSVFCTSRCTCESGQAM